MDNKLAFLIRQKPLDILLELEKENESYGQYLSWKTGCTYSHAVKIINILEGLSIIKSKKIGRKRLLKLTSKGEALCKHLNEVVKLI